MKRRDLLKTGGAALVLSSGAGQMAFAQEASIEIPDMVLGSADAPVEMIEYASFTCPYCARFHADVWPQLKADYIESGKVRFIYREVYFDRFGLWASMIARCAGEVGWYQANAERDGVNSTPSFLINGEPHGNMAYAELKALLDEKIGDA